MTWCILATGNSTSPTMMQQVRHLPCIAVNNAYLDAPWSRALVANDAAWWRQYPEAKLFAGEKFCGTKVLGTTWMAPGRLCAPSSNSALRALDLAIHHYQATRVILLGVDMTGPHYHADHPAPLGNPNAVRFALFLAQLHNYFARGYTRGVDVLNCSMVSRVECFTKCSLEQALEWMPESSTAA